MNKILLYINCVF